MLRDNLLALNQSNGQDNSVLTISVLLTIWRNNIPSNDLQIGWILFDLVQQVDHLCKLEKVKGLTQIPGEPHNLLFFVKKILFFITQITLNQLALDPLFLYIRVSLQVIPHA